MQVLKFGGTSVANADNINKVVAIISQNLVRDDAPCKEGYKTIVVVSALGGVTDLLLSAAALAAEGDEALQRKIDINRATPPGSCKAINTCCSPKPVTEPGEKELQ